MRSLISKSDICHCSAIVTFLKALKLKGEYLHNHSVMVGLLAERVGKVLSFSKENLFVLKTAGLLHDIGKIAVHDQILLKPTILNAYEWEQIKLHPLIAYKALESIPALKRQAEIILYHHIGVNGNSYPSDIDYKNIPFESKIIKICDVFTALTSERPYKATFPRRYAIEICQKEVPFACKNLTEKICDALLANPPITTCDARGIDLDIDHNR